MFISIILNTNNFYPVLMDKTGAFQNVSFLKFMKNAIYLEINSYF